ncbi:MAG: RpoL/Rpb11 RNA polymerase subunit family protein [Candidatus Aenigmatarchaeota archaeon]
MEINVLKEEKDSLLIELKGESETFANMLREELWNVGVVEVAFIKEHPELAETKLWIKADNPREKLRKAIDNLIEKLEKIKEAYENALKA